MMQIVYSTVLFGIHVVSAIITNRILMDVNLLLLREYRTKNFQFHLNPYRIGHIYYKYQMCTWL